MKSSARILLAAVAMCSTPGIACAELQVAASIKPIHSLVAGVMDGVGEPELIVAGANSPHAFSLRPSQATALEDADLIFWVGPEIETSLAKPIATIAKDASAVALIDAPGLARLAFREGGAFESHGRDGGDTTADHGHGELAASGQGDDEHEHDGFDGHVWLDPENAKLFVGAIVDALARHDPDNAATYQANAAALAARLDALISEVDATLAPVRGKGFVVFHDAYQYFEKRFAISAAGSITVSPDVMPGAERIGEIQVKLQELGAACVFAEPQFAPKLVTVVTQGTNARSALLDPLGADLADGPDLYFDLIRNLAKSMRDCLVDVG